MQDDDPVPWLRRAERLPLRPWRRCCGRPEHGPGRWWPPGGMIPIAPPLAGSAGLGLGLGW